MENETLIKFEKMKHIMKKIAESRKGSKGSRKPHTVGMIADVEENDFWWLKAALNSHYFSEIIKKIKLINTSDIDPKKTLRRIFSCTFIFFICSGYNQKTFPAMRQRVGFFFEWENLIIIIDNLEDSSEAEKKKILQENPDCVQREENIFLFSKRERGTNYLIRLLNDGPSGSVRLKKKESFLDHGTSTRNHNEQQRRKTVYGTSTGGNGEHFYQDKIEKKNLEMVKSDLGKGSAGLPSGSMLDDGIGHQPHPSQTREIKCHQVGIFSRSTDRDYPWLVKTLKSEEFSCHVGNVKSLLISNNHQYQEFIDAINQCTFGILYHSKNRGAVNVTNVTGALYDEELKTLHMILEKENVLVIIDDLEDSSDDQKADLLQEQNSIAKQAVDLLLVSHSDKTDPRLLRKKTDQLRSLLRGTDVSLENQLETKQQENRAQPSSMSTIGIFSRSEESDYFWLKKLLTSGEFGQRNVKCYKVSDSGDASEEAAFKIKFGVVYHSVKNGNIRLTDLKRSEYHRELEQLSTKLGKRRIIVVIDDLDDSGHKLKQQILEKQPSLGRLVAEIFVFTTAEKKNMDGGKHRKKMSKSTMDKISIMKKILS